MAQSILYYPNINIDNKAWLRSAVLYWDEVCSIVPRADVELSQDLLQLEAHGIYRRIYPGGILWSQDSKKFMEKVGKRFEKIKDSTQAKRVSEEFERYSFIHIEKFPEDFPSVLKEMNVRFSQHGYWIETEEAFANVYMRTLAEYIAKKDPKDIVLGTDKEDNFGSMYTNGKSWKRERDLMFSLMLVQCLPVPSIETDIDKVIRFKETRKYELLELREKIRKVEKDLINSKSVEQFVAVMEAFKESWQKELIMSKKLFEGDGIGVVFDTLGTYISNLGNMKGVLELIDMCVPGTVNQPIANVAIGMTGGITLGLQCRKYKKKVKEQCDGGFAYIIEAAKKKII